MIYLGEREIGFHATDIGFPSILGCRAVVLVTGSGLFGFHLNGALSTAKLNAFVNFITQHVHGNGRRMLYAASAETGLAKQYAEAELKNIATALGYIGPVYWASLPAGGSAYVHFMNVNNTTCSITARTWNDAVDGVAANKGPYVAGADRAIANGAPNANMYVNVSTAGLRAVYPVKL